MRLKFHRSNFQPQILSSCQETSYVALKKSSRLSLKVFKFQLPQFCSRKKASDQGLGNYYILPVILKLLHCLPSSPSRLKNQGTLLHRKISVSLFPRSLISTIKVLNGSGCFLHLPEPVEDKMTPDIGLDHDDDINHGFVTETTLLHSPPRLKFDSSRLLLQIFSSYQFGSENALSFHNCSL